MEYSVAIRTLGRAGEKYQRLLNSLMLQTIKPQRVVVYIAEGYDLPPQTIGIEQYVYVKKGMISQRALKYYEINTEYILFLDDDVELSVDSVERMYNALVETDSDVVAPDTFANNKMSNISKIMMLLSGRMIPRYHDKKWAYKVIRTAGFSYNNNPCRELYYSQTNAGPCFMCRKDVFLSINYEDELWMDAMPYAIGDDQAMFYKMYLHNYRILTIFNSGVVHLDAGTTLLSYDRQRTLVYSDIRFKLIFWHRFIYKLERNFWGRFLDICALMYMLLFTVLTSIVKLDMDFLKIKLSAINDAYEFISSEKYKSIAPVV